MHSPQVSRVVLDMAPEVLDRVRVRSGQNGITVVDYLRSELEKATSILWGKELWELLKQLPRVELGESSADLVRAVREERMQYLDELFDDLRNRH
jgi:hypothetical protein